MTFKAYKPKNYLAHIDGLRGIAVLAVLLFHLDIALFKGGFVGVDIFFVISGYLITGIIVRDLKEQKFSFAKFYARRIRRIFPALFFLLFATSIAALFFLGPEQFTDHFKALRMASAQVSNFYFARELDYFAPDQNNVPLLHTWTLGVEEQFYFVWPLLLFGIHRIWGISRSFIILAALLILSLIISEYLVHTDALQAFYMLHSRAWELAMGGLVALNVIPPARRQSLREGLAALGLVMIFASLILITEDGFPGIKALVPVFGASLLIYALQSGECRIQKLLSVRPLVWCGLISYSLYLWHWPFIAFYKGYFGEELSSLVQISIVILSFLAAIFSYRFVELPFRFMTVHPKRMIAAGLCCIVVFIVGSNFVKTQNRASWRIAYEQDDAVVEPHRLFKVCSIAGGAFDKERCYIGPNKDSYEVILVGDSFASHFTPMILGWAQEKGLTVRLFTRGACRVWVKDEGVRYKAGKLDQDCMDLTPAFYEALKNDKSIQYVFIGLRDTKLTDNMRRSLKDIMDYDKKTYFLGVGPLFSEHPHNCQIKNHLLISKVWSRPQQRTDCLDIDFELVREELAPFNAEFKPYLDAIGIPYFDPLKYMDTPFNDAGVFLFADAGHMNEYGGLYLLPYFERFMNENDSPQ